MKLEVFSIGKQVTIHKMVRKSERINSNLNMINYSSSLYHNYKNVCCHSFYVTSKQNGLDPFEFYSMEDLLAKSENIFVYMDNNELIGAVEIKGNEIEHIFINNLFKGQGYGKKILNFSINYIFKNNYSVVVLFVTDLNEPAKKFYLKNGFKIEKTFFEEW